MSNNIYHLDFETYQSAVPPFNGLKPYQQIPFQYSAHYEKNGKIEHYEFLADGFVLDQIDYAEAEAIRALASV